MMSSQDSANKKECIGHCHCKKFSYKFTYPQFENGEENVFSCNCTICKAKGLLLLRVDKTEITFISGSMEELTCYKWHTDTYHHHFCPVCGTETVETWGNNVAINLRTVEGVDLEKLKLKPFDGANTL